ncbi:MAG TPA: YigZ family protein [Spirochaetia bacterium]|nr:YigZ family protein [Spirochaetia bacterium]
MKVPVEGCSAEIVVRRSRFIAEGSRLDDPATVKARVAKIRESHPGCTHVVWAFLCGSSGETAGMSDDHEPKGTAGRPVLEVIRGSGITNLLVTVTRYFGGTKLGTGGLVRSYTAAAQTVITAIPVQELVERRSFRLTMPYELYDPLKRLAEEFGVATTAESFTSVVVVEGSLPAALAEEFSRRVKSATSGRVEPDFAR